MIQRFWKNPEEVKSSEDEGPEAPSAASKDDWSAPTASPDALDEVAETLSRFSCILKEMRTSLLAECNAWKGSCHG